MDKEIPINRSIEDIATETMEKIFESYVPDQQVEFVKMCKDMLIEKMSDEFYASEKRKEYYQTKIDEAQKI